MTSEHATTRRVRPAVMGGAVMGLAMIFALGCGDVAVLELHLRLPERPILVGDEPLDRVQVSAAGGDAIFTYAFADSAPHLSLVADSPGPAPLDLELTFCSVMGCDSASPRVAVTVEEPFYEARRTAVTLCVPAGRIEVGYLPGLPGIVGGEPCVDTRAELVVPRCAVAGCLGGPTRDFCRRDGTHYCVDAP